MAIIIKPLHMLESEESMTFDYTERNKIADSVALLLWVYSNQTKPLTVGLVRELVLNALSVSDDAELNVGDPPTATKSRLYSFPQCSAIIPGTRDKSFRCERAADHHGDHRFSNELTPDHGQSVIKTKILNIGDRVIVQGKHHAVLTARADYDHMVWQIDPPLNRKSWWSSIQIEHRCSASTISVSNRISGEFVCELVDGHVGPHYNRDLYPDHWYTDPEPPHKFKPGDTVEINGARTQLHCKGLRPGNWHVDPPVHGSDGWHEDDMRLIEPEPPAAEPAFKVGDIVHVGAGMDVYRRLERKDDSYPGKWIVNEQLSRSYAIHESYLTLTHRPEES